MTDTDDEPRPGEVWEQADGCLMLRRTGGTRRGADNEVIGRYDDYWTTFGEAHVADDNEYIRHPLRRRFDTLGNPTSDEPLRYPPEVVEAQREWLARHG